MRPTSLLAASIAAALLLHASAHAGEGHDHGDAAPAASAAALPRFTAASESFELVGILDGSQITLYLDRAADNAPVRDAQIELEIGGAKLQAAKHDDAYEVVLAAAPPAGVLPVTATVTAGTDTDLLAGELDIHGDAHADEAAHSPGWQAYAGKAAAAGAVLAVLVLLVLTRKRIAARRKHRTGATA